VRVPIRQWGLVTEGEYSYVGLPMGLWDSKAMPQTAKIPAWLCLLFWGWCPPPPSDSANRSEAAKACSVRGVWVQAAGCWGNVLLGAISGIAQLLWGYRSLVKLACLARAGSKHTALCWQDTRAQDTVLRNPGPATYTSVTGLLPARACQQPVCACGI
jgi:hypothetical protein